MARCDDINCPVHGTLSTRGGVLEGTVMSDKMDKTVIVQRDYYVKAKKYDRYKRAKRISRLSFKDLDRFMKRGRPASYGVMDSLALKIIKRSRIKTIIIDGSNPENILKVLKGKKIGTLISN